MKNNLTPKFSKLALTALITTSGMLLCSHVEAQSLIKSPGEHKSFSLIAQVNCEDTNNVPEANACLAEADLELNKAYQQLIRGLTGEDRRKLILAEQSWIKYRDANCAFRIREFTLNTSMGLRFYSVCKTRITKERTEELKR
jgi:uncharacterized protein YecT (DUF1311 family)